MTLKHRIGSLRTQKNVQSATSSLRRMVDVTTWCVKIKIVKLISVGCVLDLGNRTVPVGIIVIVTTKKRLKPQETLKKNQDPRYKDTYFIAIDTWIICSRWNSKINFMQVLKKKWKKCSNIICRGSRWNRLELKCTTAARAGMLN